MIYLGIFCRPIQKYYANFRDGRGFTDQGDFCRLSATLKDILEPMSFHVEFVRVPRPMGPSFHPSTSTVLIGDLRYLLNPIAPISRADKSTVVS